MRSIAVRYPVESSTTSVARTRSPGVRPTRSEASRTLNGIVIPGMNPLMSSCLMVISPRTESTARICPRSSYARPRLHAAVNARKRSTPARTRSPEEHRWLKSNMRFTVAGWYGRGKAPWLRSRPTTRSRRAFARVACPPDVRIPARILLYSAGNGSPLLACAGSTILPHSNPRALSKLTHRFGTRERCGRANHARQFWQG